MKKLTDDQLNNEIAIFSTYVHNGGVDLKLNMTKLCEKLKTAGGALNENTGIAFPGGLVSHINLSTKIASKIANEISQFLPVNMESVYKVSTLMHLSKILMFMPNPSTWEIQNRGMNYTFAETEGNLKFGIRSVQMCMERGIVLTPTEIEAMTILDKTNDVNNYVTNESTLSMVIRQANELAYAIERKRNSKK